MNAEVPIIDYADKQCIISHFRDRGIQTAIRQWTKTANELFGEGSNEIATIHQVYKEIGEQEYRDWQILKFVSALLGSLPAHDRHRLIAFRARHCRKKTD